METILKKGLWKVLYLFYINRNSKIHLREIARKTKLNENSVSRFLKELGKKHILVSEKEGNLKKFYVNKEKIPEIFQLFDKEKFDKLPSLRKNAIKYFLDKLKEKPIIVVLFGSTAKESFTRDSDIDLFFIVNKKIEIRDAENYAESQTGIKLNCFQIDYDDFLTEIKMKKDKVVQSAINSGYPIFNPLNFYEVLYED